MIAFLRHISPILAAAALSAPVADAQVASAMIREGDPMPFGPNHKVSTGINSVTVNSVGGYAAQFNSTDGSNPISVLFGNTSGGPPAILLSEITGGTFTHDSIENNFGIDDAGALGYSAVTSDPPNGIISVDAIFKDLTPLAFKGDPIALLPGKQWNNLDRPGITGGGANYWRGGIIDQATFANEGNGLFLLGLPLIKTGDVIPGFPGPLDIPGVNVNFRFSSSGQHYITLVDVVSPGDTADDGWMVLDGQAIPTFSGLIGEDEQIPVQNGGLPNERWDNFKNFGITNQGDYAMTGDSEGIGSANDAFLVWNGKIILREGDTVDGVVLGNTQESLDVNDQGDIAMVWQTTTGEVLLFNTKALLKTGDAVDLDGDGVIEPTSTISNFTGSSVAVGEDRKVYFIADVDTLGTSATNDDTKAFFVIEDPCGSVRRYGLGCAGAGGFVPELALTGCAQVGGSVTLEISEGLGNSTAVLLLGLQRFDTLLTSTCYLNVAQILPAAFTLPLGGGPFPGSGSISIPFTIPAGSSGVPFTLQAFVADNATPIGATTTNGLEVVITP